MLLTLLIIASAACLATGLITANTVFTYVALGLAVVGALLIIGNITVRKRKIPDSASDTAGDDDEGPSDQPRSASADHPNLASTVDPVGSDHIADSEMAAAGASEPTPESASSPSAAEISSIVAHEPAENPAGGPVETDLVFVVPGRKRFHRDDCHLLRNDSQELTLEEAREEGFTGCTACASDLSCTNNSSMVGHRS